MLHVMQAWSFGWARSSTGAAGTAARALVRRPGFTKGPFCSQVGGRCQIRSTLPPTLISPACPNIAHECASLRHAAPAAKLAISKARYTTPSFVPHVLMAGYGTP
jgi:hypothetical protein